MHPWVHLGPLPISRSTERKHPYLLCSSLPLWSSQLHESICFRVRTTQVADLSLHLGEGKNITGVAFYFSFWTPSKFKFKISKLAISPGGWRKIINNEVSIRPQRHAAKFSVLPTSSLFLLLFEPTLVDFCLITCHILTEIALFKVSRNLYPASSQPSSDLTSLQDLAQWVTLTFLKCSSHLTSGTQQSLSFLYASLAVFS